MTEIPEHLLAKAKAAREKKATTGGGADAPAAEAPAAKAAAPAEPEAPQVDEARDALVAEFAEAMGEGVVETHVAPGRAAWVRVDPSAWVRAHETLRRRLGFDFFDFVSVIDWLPSPFGRDMDAQVDLLTEGATPADPGPREPGVTGGDTRFQVFSHVISTKRSVGLLLKADIPDDTLAVETLIPVYAGANWHEREAYEMYGIEFVGHPDLRNIYLPTEFEGHPMRKDFPLLARRIKPWPGIVDVEAMPGDAGGEDEE